MRRALRQWEPQQSADSPLLPFLAPRIFAPRLYERDLASKRLCHTKREAVSYRRPSSSSPSSRSSSSSHHFYTTRPELPTSKICRNSQPRLSDPKSIRQIHSSPPCLRSEPNHDKAVNAKKSFFGRSHDPKAQAEEETRLRLESQGLFEELNDNKVNEDSTTLEPYTRFTKLSRRKRPEPTREQSLFEDPLDHLLADLYSAESFQHRFPDHLPPSLPDYFFLAPLRHEAPLQTSSRAAVNQRVSRTERERRSILRSDVSIRMEVDRSSRFQPVRIVHLRRKSSSGIEELSTGWTRSIARIQIGFDSRLDSVMPTKRTPSFPHPPNNQHLAKQWADQLPLNDLQRFRESWISMNPSVRAVRWHQIILWFLRHDPRRALPFLTQTCEIDPKPDRWKIADVLDVLACYSLRDEWSINDIRMLLRTFAHILQLHGQDFHPTQRTIRIILAHCQDIRSEQMPTPSNLLAFLEAHAVPIHVNTMLHFASALSKQGQIQVAIEVLEKAIAARAVYHNTALTNSCLAVLRESGESETTYLYTPAIIQRLFAVWLQPSPTVFNILMANAFKNDHAVTGWRILTDCLDSSIQLQDYSLTLALRQAREENSKQRFQTLNSIVENRDTDDIHPYLGTELMLNHVQWTNNFPTLLSLFERYWDLEPLRTIGIISSERSSRRVDRFGNPKPPSRLQPPSNILGMMITSFLANDRPSSEQVEAVYLNFLHLVHERTPIFTDAARSQIVWHSFLRAFLKKDELRRQWPQILSDMNECFTTKKVQTRAATTSLPLATGDETSSGSPLATPQTWNIIVNGLSLGGETGQAQRLANAMESRGMRLTAVTWNSLLGGHAKQGDEEEIRRVLEGMQENKVKPDKHTVKALRRHADPEAFAELLQKVHREAQGSSEKGQTTDEAGTRGAATVAA